MRKAWGLDSGMGGGDALSGQPWATCCPERSYGGNSFRLFCCPQPLSLVHTLAYSILLVFIFYSKAIQQIVKCSCYLSILLSVGNLHLVRGPIDKY